MRWYWDSCGGPKIRSETIDYKTHIFLTPSPSPFVSPGRHPKEPESSEMLRFVLIASLCVLVLIGGGEGKKKKKGNKNGSECSSGGTLHSVTCDLIRCAFISQLSGCNLFTPVVRLPAKCRTTVLSYFYGPFKCMEPKYNESFVVEHIEPEAVSKRRRKRQADGGSNFDDSFLYFQCMLLGNCPVP
ncbi:uncharacterized protein LOC135490897 [Lineus longissimus]|uniref:uncharacterized protein LOC135490897 n=1 Tax=Lineus longissimus TaxID=88925 RepID=UPI00315D675E